MKFILALLATALVTVVSGMFAPWWSVAIAAGVVGLLITQSGTRSFFGGFIGVALAWISMTVWIDQANGGILSARMALILPVGGNVLYLHLVTALLGGVIGGLSALSGAYIRALLWRPEH